MKKSIPTQDEVKSWIESELDNNINKFKSFPSVDKVMIDNAGSVTIQASADTLAECGEWERILRKCALHFGHTKDVQIVAKQVCDTESMALGVTTKDVYYDIECNFETL